MIVQKAIDYLKATHSDYINDLRISEVRIGVYMTAVILSDGSCGIASTSLDEHCCEKKNRDFGDFSPSKIENQKVTDLLDLSKPSSLIDTLKIAVINAIASAIPLNPKYKVLENTDPIDLIDLSGSKTITIVGAFQNYIQTIAGTKNNLFVLELNENMLSEPHKKFFIPANEYKRVIPVSDIVILTGLTIVNNTIDGLLESVSDGTKVIITGPSAGMIPEVLFKNKVNIIGTTRVTDSRLLMKVVSEAGTGYHFFRYCAKKICITSE